MRGFQFLLILPMAIAAAMAIGCSASKPSRGPAIVYAPALQVFHSNIVSAGSGRLMVVQERTNGRFDLVLLKARAEEDWRRIAAISHGTQDQHDPNLTRLRDGRLLLAF